MATTRSRLRTSALGAIAALAGPRCGVPVCGTDRTPAAMIHTTGDVSDVTPEMSVAICADASAQRTVRRNGYYAPKTWPAGSAEVARLLHDMETVGDVSSIPTYTCAQNCCTTITTISASGKTSGDLECADAGTPAQMVLVAECRALLFQH